LGQKFQGKKPAQKNREANTGVSSGVKGPGSVWNHDRIIVSAPARNLEIANGPMPGRDRL
jgi:hypothetical protein